MSNLIPATWRDSVEHLTDNVREAAGRWLPRLHWRAPHGQEMVWPGALFEAGGPAIDVVEDDGAVRITAELPGLNEKEFSVELTDRRLVLRGEKKGSREDKGKNYYYSECSYGSFARSIPLPCEVDGGKVEARYKNGVLEVTLPKTEAARARRVKVEVK